MRFKQVLKSAAKSEKSPKQLLLITWGVDYVLLDKNKEIISNSF